MLGEPGVSAASLEDAMRRFEGRVALITGGASGVGRATSIRLASEGAAVLAVDVNEDGLAETSAEITSDSGRVKTQRCDVSSVTDCAAAVAGCVDAFGRLDVLGNIAGVSWQRHVAEVTEAEWDQMFAINVKGPFFLAQAALPHLLESHGTIINIASNAAIMGMAYTVPYCATKGAVAQLTRALAMEFVKQPVRVNAIAPGGVDTPMTRNFKLPHDIDWDLIKRGISFRDMSKPEQIAALFAFLASDEALNIHGAIISADHGLTTG